MQHTRSNGGDPHRGQESAPWLSILIPVYNVAPYLAECVDSILAQGDDPGIEILLLDDASTDGSLALCEQLCAAHPHRLRLLRHERNRGLSAARNSMLAQARGDYIWFLDSDDYLLPGSLSAARAIIDSAAPDLLLFDYRKDRSKGRVRVKRGYAGRSGTVQRDRASLVAGVFNQRKMYSWCRIARRSLWSDDLRFPEGRHFEDIATTPWLLLRAQSHYHHPAPLVHYRVRPGSIMTSVTQTKGYFDAAKHEDMARAMGGFPQSLRPALPESAGNAVYQTSYFVARQYASLAERHVAAQRDVTQAEGLPPLSHYRDLMEQCSPLPLRSLVWRMAARLRLRSALALWRGLAAADRGSTSPAALPGADP